MHRSHVQQFDLKVGVAVAVGIGLQQQVRSRGLLGHIGKA